MVDLQSYEWPTEFEFPVTQAHISIGVPRKCSSCPIAIAVKEYFAERGVEVFPDVAYHNLRLYAQDTDVYTWYPSCTEEPIAPVAHYRLPKQADQFQTRFDGSAPSPGFSTKRKQVEPTAFKAVLAKTVQEQPASHKDYFLDYPN